MNVSMHNALEAMDWVYPAKSSLQDLALGPRHCKRGINLQEDESVHEHYRSKAGILLSCIDFTPDNNKTPLEVCIVQQLARCQ